jgi:CheY-like chemotaxis protein
MSQNSGVIVVADDDADILDLVSLTLERAGHVVHRARDGEEALELVRHECPDVAVLDVAMPRPAARGAAGTGKTPSDHRCLREHRSTEPDQQLAAPGRARVEAL